MITRLIIIASFFLTATITSGQAIVKERLSQRDANNLLRSLTKKIEDTRRIDILLDLTDYHLQKESYKESDLDSAAMFIRNAKELDARQISRKRAGRILLLECSLAIRGGNLNEARKLANHAIALLEEANDELHLVQAYLKVSRCYDQKVPEQATEVQNAFNKLFQVVPNRISKAQLSNCILEIIDFYSRDMFADNNLIKLHLLDHLVRTCRQINDKLNEFWVRKEIADLHYQQGNLDLAINELLDIAKEQKAGGYARISFTYDLLSGLYLASGNLDKALFYSLETIKNINTKMDSAYLPEFYSRVAANYSVTGSVARAIEWNVKSLNYQIAIKKTERIYSIIYDIASDLITLKRGKEALDIITEKSRAFIPSNIWEKRSMLLTFAKAYAAVHNNEMAEKYCDESIKFNEWLRKQKLTSRDPTLDQFLSQFYVNIGKYDKAEKYFNRLNEEGSKANKTGILFNSRFLFKLDSGRGKYPSAIKHLHEYQRAKDSIYSASKSKQIESLKIGYETDLKEKNIQLLTKQDQLQKNKLDQEAVLRNISLAIVALLILVTALLYNRYRQKQKTNRLLQSQQETINKSNHELTQLNERQKKLLKEKEWLIKEIHHRVKNNLQMAISLLNAQTEFLNNPTAVDAIKESRERMQAIAIIHQKLYQVDNTTEVNMRSYITELVDNIKNSFAGSERIYFKLDVDDVGLDISQSVPLGLILNEAVTNAVKYAYAENEKGPIRISLKHYESNKLQLKISDQGKGLPDGFEAEDSNTLGLQLINLFSEQLEGKVFFINKDGLEIILNFTPVNYRNSMPAKIVHDEFDPDMSKRLM